MIAFLAGTNAENKVSGSSERKLIINGDTVDPSEHQFFVRSAFDTVRETDDLLCGASLIHSDMIVTAAHCHGGFNYGARLYNPDEDRFNQFKEVDLQIAYPRYYEDVEIINYDLLLLRLESPVTNVAPIELNRDPSFPLFRNFNGAQQSVLLEGLGVGLTENGIISRGLEAGYFRAMSNPQCGARLGVANVIMSDDVMCADPNTDDSICAGDSGGPLSARISVATQTTAASRSPWSDDSKPLLVGVTTFGNDCLVDDIPDGFSRISYYYDWIREQICNYSNDPPSDCLEYYESDKYTKFLATQDTSDFADDKVRITMKFQHDFMAEQTTFAFRNTDTDQIEYVGPQYVPARAEFVESEFLLPVPGNYAVEIHDTKGDGLTNPDFAKKLPNGSWSISAEYNNGARIEDLASGDHDFKKLQTRFIELPHRMEYNGTAPADPSESAVYDFEWSSEVEAQTQTMESSSSVWTTSVWGLTALSLALVTISSLE